MAAKSTKGKKNTKSTAKKTQQKSGQSQNRDEIRGEIIILGLLAVCILLVLSNFGLGGICLLYTSPSPRDVEESRMPSSA